MIVAEALRQRAERGLLRIRKDMKVYANLRPALCFDALKDASTLLSVPVTAGDVVDWDVVRWGGALPFASLGHKGRVAEVRSICAADGTVALVGGWLSGNGLAAIVADTPKQVRQLLS